MLQNISLRYKMLLVVAVCTLCLVVMGLLAQRQIIAIGVEIAQIAEENIPLTEVGTRITAHQFEQVIQLERAIRFGEEMQSHPEIRSHFESASKKFGELGAKVDEEIIEGEHLAEKVIATTSSEAAKVEFEKVLNQLLEIESAHKRFGKDADEMLQMLAAGDVKKALKIANALEERADVFTHEIEAMLFEIEKFTAESALTAEAHEHQAELVIWAAIVVSSLHSVLVGLFIVEKTVRPLRRAVDAVDALAGGDTTVELQSSSRDEVGQLSTAVETLRNLSMASGVCDP